MLCQSYKCFKAYAFLTHLTNLSGNAKPHYVDTFGLQASENYSGIGALWLLQFCTEDVILTHVNAANIQTFGAVRAVLRLYQEQTHRNTRHAAHAHAHAH